MIVLVFHKKFQKGFSKLPHKIQEKARDALLLFQENPSSKRLRLHHLQGSLREFESIDITGDIRIIVRYNRRRNCAEVIAIGTHSMLYG